MFFFSDRLEEITVVGGFNRRSDLISSPRSGGKPRNGGSAGKHTYYPCQDLSFISSRRNGAKPYPSACLGPFWSNYFEVFSSFCHSAILAFKFIAQFIFSSACTHLGCSDGTYLFLVFPGLFPGSSRTGNCQYNFKKATTDRVSVSQQRWIERHHL